MAEPHPTVRPRGSERRPTRDARMILEWPKRRPCLWCGRLRWTPAPADRFHPGCRAVVQLVAELVEPVWWRW